MTEENIYNIVNDVLADLTIEMYEEHLKQAKLQMRYCEGVIESLEQKLKKHKDAQIERLKEKASNLR